MCVFSVTDANSFEEIKDTRDQVCACAWAALATFLPKLLS